MRSKADIGQPFWWCRCPGCSLSGRRATIIPASGNGLWIVEHRGAARFVAKRSHSCGEDRWEWLSLKGIPGAAYVGGLRIVRLEVASIHPSINAKDPSVSAKFKLTSAQRRGVPLGEHPFHGMFGIRVVVGQTAGRLSTPSLVSRLSATRCSNRARHVAAGVSRS